MHFQNITNLYQNIIYFAHVLHIVIIKQVKCRHYTELNEWKNLKACLGRSWWFLFKLSLCFEESTLYFLASFFSRIIYKCHQVTRPHYFVFLIMKLQHAGKDQITDQLLGLVIIPLTKNLPTYKLKILKDSLHSELLDAISCAVYSLQTQPPRQESCVFR